MEKRGNASAFTGLYETVARLRGEGGCPWDLEQTPESLRGDLIEETYECIEAIDERDSGHIKEELGDLFLLVTMLSYMHEQEGHFTVADVLEGITEKLIRRHPHVFAEMKVRDSGEVLQNWARIKVEQEGRRPKDSVLDEVSAALPPLDRAWKLQKKAAGAGFDWPGIQGVFGKLEEELDEVKSALRAALCQCPPCPSGGGDSREPGGGDAEGPGGSEPGGTGNGGDAARQVEEELGDLLFSAVNLCRFLKVEPSVALQRTNAKFTRRFKYVEQEMKKTGTEMTAGNLPVMDRYWEEAKEKAKRL
ncbi:MAG: nucleoside triphosphate pyrophosphohydrolase [Spirochaetaceae bacterium]|jgi:tetrapyrrole methylase family protein/MazG family protein|nr:nucleoside triphosphate pyrophosphohydrolase [Spirochaetaceae bacterium]